MGITFGEISALVARYGNERIEEQVNMNAPFVGMIDKVNPGGRVLIVNIKGGGLDSTGWLSDGAQMPSGAVKEPVQATANPCYLLSRIAVPRGAATLANGDGEGVDIVFEQIDSAGADLARKLGRGIIDSSVQTLTSAQATQLGASGTTLTVNDDAGFRVGDILERRDSTNVLEEYLRVEKVVIDEDGASHTLTLTRTLTIGDGATLGAGAPAAGDKLYHVGGYSKAPVNLDQCADETTDVYGHDADTNDWTGNTRNQAGAFDVAGLRDLYTKTCRRGGQMPDFVLMNSRVRQIYSDTLLANRRYHSGKMDATGGVEIDFEGKPVKVDENTPTTKAYLVKKSNFKLAVFKDFADEKDGGMVAPSDSGHALVSQTNFEYDMQRWGAYQVWCNKRNNLGSLTGITG